MFVLSHLAWFVLSPDNLLLLAATAGAAGFVWKRLRRLKPLLPVSLGLQMLLAFTPLGEWTLVPLENRFTRPDALPPNVAGVILLGGAQDTAVSSARKTPALTGADPLLAFADLAKRLPKAALYFSGGVGKLVDDRWTESDVMAKVLPSLGVDPARVVFENASRSTLENARNLARIIKPEKHPGDVYLLVTFARHTPRSVAAFQSSGFQVIPWPSGWLSEGGFAVRPPGRFGPGLGRFTAALHEWIGLCYYRLSGATDVLFPGPTNKASTP